MAQFRSDHLHLRSVDPERMAAFFAEMFGATETQRVRSGANLRIILDLGGLTLFVEEVRQGTAAPPTPPFLGVEHIGLAVNGFDDAIAELRRKGATFSMEPTSPRPGLRIAFVQGPDSLRVEVLERSAE